MNRYLLLPIAFICSSIEAQNVVDDDFGAEDLENTTVSKIKETDKGDKGTFFKSFSGSVGHSSVFGTEDNYRNYTHLRLRFDKYWFSYTRTVLEGIFENTQIKLIQTPRNSESGLPEKKLNYNSDILRAEEVYISQEITDLLELSYGIQKTVWGQFEPYSPSNFVFPFNLSTTDVEFNKVKGTLPQLAGIATIYPFSNLSLAFYVFPRLTYDAVIKKRLNEPGYDSDRGERENKSHIPQISKSRQKAFRLMYYPSWGTLGFSYFDGYNASFPFDDIKIKREDADGGSYQHYVEDVTTTLAEMTAFSFEMAIPVGRATYKLEYSLQKNMTSLPFNRAYWDISDLESNEQQREQKEYIDALNNDNQSSLSLPAINDVLAMGVTANFTRWYINFVLFYINERFADEEKDLAALAERADTGEDDDGYDGPIFPGLVLSYSFDPEKKSEAGLAAGIIGNGQGLALFYKKATDSFVYGGALQMIEYFFTENVESSLDKGYKRKDDTVLGILLSLTYKF